MDYYPNRELCDSTHSGVSNLQKEDWITCKIGWSLFFSIFKSIKHHLFDIRKMQRRNNRSRFVWSLDPIFGWMRLIGIELDCSIIRSKRESVALLSFSILLFVFSFVCNVWVVVHKLRQFINNNIRGPPLTFVKTIVFSINTINIAFLSVGSHFAFMIGVQRNWHQLFKTIQQIERDLKSPSMFQRCRKLTRLGVVFLILVIT